MKKILFYSILFLFVFIYLLQNDYIILTSKGKLAIRETAKKTISTIKNVSSNTLKKTKEILKDETSPN